MAKKKLIKVDMSEVEDGFTPADEGWHTVKVEDVSVEQGNDSGEDYLKVELKIKKKGGGKLWTNLSLQPQALWKLRGFLIALGLDVPKKVIEVDPSDWIGEELDVLVEHEKYQGKTKGAVVDFAPAGEGGEESEEEEEEDEDEEEAPRKKKDKKRDEDEEDEEDEEEEDEDEDEEEEKPKKKGKKKSSEDEDEEEEEEDEEEEEEAEFEDGDKVTFKDDGKKYKGTVVKVNTKKKFCEVKVGDDRWEIEFENLKKV